MFVNTSTYMHEHIYMYMAYRHVLLYVRMYLLKLQNIELLKCNMYTALL